MTLSDGHHNYAACFFLLHTLCKRLRHCLLPGELSFEEGLKILDCALLVLNVFFADTFPVSKVPSR